MSLIKTKLAQIYRFSLLIIKWSLFQILKKQGFVLTGLDHFNKVDKGGIVLGNHVGHLESMCALLMLNVKTRVWTKNSAVKNVFGRFIGRRFFIYVDAAPLEEVIATSQAALQDGQIIFITPEGTRNFGMGLRRGQPGAARVLLGLKGAIIAPVGATYTPSTDSSVWDALKPHPDFVAHFGPAFRIKYTGKLGIRVLQDIADEMMVRVAEMLPTNRRGYYTNMMGQPYKYTETVE